MALLRSLGNGVAFVVLGFVVAACGSDDGGGGGGSGGTGTGGTGGGTGGGGTGGGTGGGDGGTAGTATGGTGGGTGGTASAFDCTAASGTINLKLTPVVQDLDLPVAAVSPPGDPRIFVLEQHAGDVRIVQGGATLPTPFLHIDGIATGNEQGMLGLAFPNDYATSGKFYVHYSAGNGDTEVHQFTVSSDPNVADPASDTPILHVNQPEENHNGGGMHFGQDGFLYLGLGDGGGAGDAHGSIGNGQSLDTMLGKMLRIDPNTPGGGKAYGIPAGNMTASGALPELWAYGLRNPWRWSFDACTGDMWIGDVGQGTYEEIDFEAKGTASGTNWGWREMEGMECYNGGSCDKSGKKLPVAVYDHGDGCSVTGGYIYRGHDIPALRGTYIYADYCSGNFWSYTEAGGATDITNDITSNGSVNQVSSFGQDSTGEMYVTSLNGTLYKIEAE